MPPRLERKLVRVEMEIGDAILGSILLRAPWLSLEKVELQEVALGVHVLLKMTGLIVSMRSRNCADHGRGFRVPRCKSRQGRTAAPVK